MIACDRNKGGLFHHNVVHLAKFAVSAAVFTTIPFLAAAASVIEISARNQTDIQQAIAQLPPSGGTVILLPADEPISIRDTVVIDRDNITLEGRGKVKLRLADKVNKPVIIVGQTRAVPNAVRSNIHLRNLVIDGNRRNQTSEFDSTNRELRNNGISLRHVENCSVENVVASGCRSGGLVTELGCRGLEITNLEAYDSEFDGLACYQTEDSLFTSLNLHNNQAAGMSVDIGFSHNTIKDSRISNNGSVGMFIRDSRDNEFSNVEIRDSAQHGVFLAQVDKRVNTPAVGNKFLGCTIANSGGAGIRVNNASCVNNLLSATQFMDNTEGPFTEAVPGLLKLGEMAAKESLEVN